MNVWGNEKFDRALHIYAVLESNCTFLCGAWAAKKQHACCLWSRVAWILQKQVGGHGSLCARGQGRYHFQTNGRRDVISVNSGICFFSLSSSLLSLGAGEEDSACTGDCVAGGQFGFSLCPLELMAKEGCSGSVRGGCVDLGATDNALGLGWPRRENKQSASPKVWFCFIELN